MTEQREPTSAETAGDDPRVETDPRPDTRPSEVDQSRAGERTEILDPGGRPQGGQVTEPAGEPETQVLRRDGQAPTGAPGDAQAPADADVRGGGATTDAGREPETKVLSRDAQAPGTARAGNAQDSPTTVTGRDGESSDAIGRDNVRDPETQVRGEGAGPAASSERTPADSGTKVLGGDADQNRAGATTGSGDPETKVLGSNAPAGGSTARGGIDSGFGGRDLYRNEDDNTVAGAGPKDGSHTRDLDDDKTAVAPAAGGAGSAGGSTARGVDPELDAVAERAASRAAGRAERNRALGKVSRPTPEPPAAAAPALVRTTDKWHGSLGLFVLRLILGGIMFVHGIQHLTSLTATQQFIDQSTILPYPEILGWVLAIGEIAIGVALILGILVRVAGLGALLVGAGALALVLWGATNPFQPDRPGFIGELELLIAGAGFLFLMVGGGRWSIDGAFRKRRRLKKEAKLAA